MDADELPQADDAELMRRAGCGDAAAFEILIRRHQHAVLGTVAKMLGSREGAEDLSQEIFLRVWKSAPRYRPEARFTTWLMTITRNMVFNECRRRKRSRLLPVADQPAEDRPQGEAPDPRQPDASEQAREAELQQAIERALARLPEKSRLAVVLRRYEDMPYEDIARVLRTSVPAVKSILFRARNELRANLAEFLP